MQLFSVEDKTNGTGTCCAQGEHCSQLEGSSSNSTSSTSNNQVVEKIGIGLTDQTKILLLHSSLYQRDKDGLAQLTNHLSTINKIDEDRKCNRIDNKTTQELISKLFI